MGRPAAFLAAAFLSACGTHARSIHDTHAPAPTPLHRSVARYRSELKAILGDASLRSAAFTPNMAAAVARQEAQDEEAAARASSSRPR